MFPEKLVKDMLADLKTL